MSKKREYLPKLPFAFCPVPSMHHLVAFSAHPRRESGLRPIRPSGQLRGLWFDHELLPEQFLLDLTFHSLYIHAPQTRFSS